MESVLTIVALAALPVITPIALVKIRDTAFRHGTGRARTGKTK